MAIATAATTDQTPDPWTGAIHQRRKALLQRLGMAAASALVFSPVVGWELSFVWFVGYLLIQALDLWVFAPINGRRATRLRGLRALAGDALLVANAGYFGSLSLPLWLVGGPLAGICATLLLSAGAIYSMINAPRSKRVLVLTVVPQFLYLATVPVFMAMFGAGTGLVTAAAVAVGVFVTYCLSTWQRMNEARIAETAARLEAERKRQDAERIMEGRSAFLAAVGHDLRTPISAILTGSVELERAAADGGSRAQARLISDAGFMMKALLDDLLDHAKLEAGHMTVDSVDFDLRDLLNQTVRLWRGPARAKGLKLRVEGAASIPAAVRGDPMRLRQVLNNLISNAMKFTPQGSITLRLRSWPEEPAGHALLIDVIDTGPGMTHEQMGRLFTPFDQIADGISARHGGTGLGLAISRQLAELMGGRLTARSRPGEGAQFTLALRVEPGEDSLSSPPTLEQQGREAVARALVGPAKPDASAPPAESPVIAATAAAPAPEPAPAEAEEADDGRPMRVLVVDDHDINRRAIQLILQPLGCDISTAADGMAALKICEATPFDLIFMDVRMPELDGRETTRRIRAGSGPNARVPVIAVTADTAPEDIAACTAAGMTYFVPKPITPQMLLGAINHVMTMAQPGDAAEMETAVA
ncbi:MAG: response regulator [Brevundimonas sp.]|uniref:ATP-binding protein n=1 Tax=Brevundimonas sp. TaxID=1871086 RepID=UPI0017A2C731|nr:ATP-binding protein [Brevundimonas sp.]MBA4804550.1 response regulator [Brevundimonas sp.]